MDRFLELTATGIPYGHHNLAVLQPGFLEMDRPVELAEPDVSVEVCVRTATVHIVPLGLFGNSLDLEAWVKSFKGDEHGLDLADRFKENTASGIPYGRYLMRVVNNGFFAAERWVDVFEPDVWVLTGMRVGEELPAYPAATGLLSGAVNHVESSEEPVYVRLLSVFSSFLVDAKVNRSGDSGTFTLAGTLPQGSYVLVTVGRTRVLDIRQVVIPAKEPVEIDLSRPSMPKAGLSFHFG